MTTSPAATSGYPGPATPIGQQDRADAGRAAGATPDLAGVRVRRVAGHLGAVHPALQPEPAAAEWAALALESPPGSRQA